MQVLGAGFPVAWGTSSFGLTNPPGTLTNVVAIGAGAFHNLVVLDNGTVSGWGDTTFGKATSPPGLTGVVAVAGGANHSLALRNNGRIVGWGDGPATNPPAFTDYMRIAAGQFHSLGLRSNGMVVGWGANNFGQINPQGGTFVSIAAGGNHSLGLRANGSVTAWGQVPAGMPLNLSGVSAIAAGDNFAMALLNNGTIVTWGSIAAPPAHANVMAIAAGGGHGMALRANRTVFCWGDNSLNQTIVPNGTSNVIAIAGGGTHSLALRMHPPRITAHPTPRAVVQGSPTTFTATFTGSTPLSFQWRRNDAPILNATNPTYTISTVSSNHAGLYSLFISNAVGTVVSTNALLTVNVPAFVSRDPTDQQVVVGRSATFSVVAGGTLPIGYQWQKEGTNLSGAVNSSYTISNATTNHAGNYRVVVSNAWGKATSQVARLTVSPIPIITSQPQSQTVLAGGSVTFGVTAENATGYQWQRNNANIPGANQTSYSISNVATNEAGNFRVVVSNQHGSVTSQVAVLTVNTLGEGESLIIQWGENPVFNGFDQVDITVPDGLIDVQGIAAGAYHDLALLRNGRVVGWGDNLFGQASSPGAVTTGAKISAGTHHSVALTSNGTVVAWGLNNLNQTNVPPGLANVVAISAGANHTLALRSNGTVAAWGHTNYGQSVVPANTTNVLAISAGFEHSMALLSNGTLRTWGNNDFGQRIAPPGVNNLIAIAAGKYHSVGLRNDGRVFAWGQNIFNQTNVPPEATDVVAIAAGANHSMALRRDGAIICWGQNNFLQLESPDGLGPIAAIAAGGNRSLALKAKLFRMEVPRVLPNGNVRLRVTHTDPSRVEIYASSEVQRPRAQWVKLNFPLTFVNGAVQGDDPGPVPTPRFYIAREKP